MCDKDLRNYNINNTEVFYKKINLIRSYFLVSYGFVNISNDCVRSYTKYKDLKNIQLLHVGFQ